MSEFKLTSVEEFEQATNELLENGAKVGADAWQFRVKNQTPHCKFGEQGTCCRICTMGALQQAVPQHIPIMAVRSATHCMRLIQTETTK